ncbi:unnamed protein product [Cylicocyclus nassatus]|uniref:HAT C-terminal dimerisation domain-containing protein n=1 Tax=Cylicocyclus nassatus TaxID=53992 RepID=A0AA36M5D8_CYLNA|nr:unnamed protein product [Cylicocyclus nassatus]
MICDVLATRGALDKLMENQSTDPFDDEELKTLKTVRTFLEPYYELTKKMCAAEATCSLLLAGGKLLLAKTESTCNEPRTRLKQFGSILLMETRRQFAPSFANETLRIAALLDPRFAYLERIASTDEWKTIVEKLIESKMGHSSSSQESLDIPTSTARDKVSSFWDPIADAEPESSAKRCLLSDQAQELMIEVQQYSILLKKSRPEKDLSPFLWWKDHANEFPILSKQVPHYLAIPATFAGIIYGNKRRGRLCGESARLLLMCKAHVNREIGRESKCWSAAEVRCYRNVVDSEDDDEDSSSVKSPVEDTTTAFEDIEDLEDVEETL